MRFIGVAIVILGVLGLLQLPGLLYRAGFLTPAWSWVEPLFNTFTVAALVVMAGMVFAAIFRSR